MLLPILIMLNKLPIATLPQEFAELCLNFQVASKRKIGWQKCDRARHLKMLMRILPSINNWKHTKHRLPILFYDISSTEVKYKLYSYILKRVKIKPRNVFTKTVNFSCYFKLFSISVKHLFRCQRKHQSHYKIVLLSATAFQLFSEAPFKWRKVVPAASTSASRVWEKRWPFCPSQHGARACSDCLKQRSHMLWFSRLDRLDPAGRTKVLYEEKLAQLGECPTIEKGYPARLVTLLAKPTFCFSC